jgi:hypothetical protein
LSQAAFARDGGGMPDEHQFGFIDGIEVKEGA